MPFINFIYAQKKMRHTQKMALIAEGKARSPKSPTKELRDSDTSEEEQVILFIKLLKKKDIMGLYVAQP